MVTGLPGHAREHSLLLAHEIFVPESLDLSLSARVGIPKSYSEVKDDPLHLTARVGTHTVPMTRCQSDRGCGGSRGDPVREGPPSRRGPTARWGSREISATESGIVSPVHTCVQRPAHRSNGSRPHLPRDPTVTPCLSLFSSGPRSPVSGLPSSSEGPPSRRR